MNTVYLDRDQCKMFDVPYFESGELSVDADVLLKSKRQGYDDQHKSILTALGNREVLLTREDSSSPGWFALGMRWEIENDTLREFQSVLSGEREYASTHSILLNVFLSEVYNSKQPVLGPRAVVVDGLFKHVKKIVISMIWDFKDNGVISISDEEIIRKPAENARQEASIH